MAVWDTWVAADGQRTRRYGRGRRWRAAWTGLDGRRHSKAHYDRDQAARHAAEMQAAATTARGGEFSLPALVAQLTARHRNRWDAGNLAAELRRRIPPGHEEAALQAALEAVAATAAALQGGASRWPGSARGGRPRTAAQVAKDAQALALRKDGRSYQEIADAIGIRSKGSAYLAVQRAVADLARQCPVPSNEAQPAGGSAAAPLRSA